MFVNYISFEYNKNIFNYNISIKYKKNNYNISIQYNKNIFSYNIFF